MRPVLLAKGASASVGAAVSAVLGGFPAPYELALLRQRSASVGVMRSVSASVAAGASFTRRAA